METAGGKREVAAMAWPLAVGMLSYTLMGVVDTLLMGKVSTAAQAGVGLGSMIAWTAISFFRGVSTGAQSLVAAAHGAQNQERIRHAGAAGVWIGAIAGVLAALVIGLIVTPFVPAIVGDDAVSSAAVDYLQVRVFAMPFALASAGYLAGIQGLGDSQARMRVSLVANVMNGGLDVVFIFGAFGIPAMGASGAALATVLSSAVMLALYAWVYRRKIGRVGAPTMETVKSSLSVGLPAGVQGLLGVIAFVVMSVVLARSGAAHLAASEIVLHIASVSFLPGFGIGEAGGVLVGRYLGAERRDAAVRSLGSARLLAVVVMAFFALLFVVGGDQLAGLFTNDPEVVRIAGTLMMFAAAFQIFDAVAMAHLCALRGAGDTRFTLIVTTAAAWGVTIPMTLLLALGLGWGAPGAWLGLTVEIIVLAVVTGWRVTGIESGRVGRMDLLLGAK